MSSDKGVSSIVPLKDGAEVLTMTRQQLRSVLDQFGMFVAEGRIFYMTKHLDEFIDGRGSKYDT